MLAPILSMRATKKMAMVGPNGHSNQVTSLQSRSKQMDSLYCTNVFSEILYHRPPGEGEMRATDINVNGQYLFYLQ